MTGEQQPLSDDLITIRTRPVGALVSVKGLGEVGTTSEQGLRVPWDHGDIVITRRFRKPVILNYLYPPAQREIDVELEFGISHVLRSWPVLVTVVVACVAAAGFLAVRHLTAPSVTDLNIRTEPPGVHVYLVGRDDPLGVTDSEGKLTARVPRSPEVALLFKKENYEPQTVTRTLDGGSNAGMIAVNLTRKPADKPDKSRPIQQVARPSEKPVAQQASKPAEKPVEPQPSKREAEPALQPSSPAEPPAALPEAKPAEERVASPEASPTGKPQTEQAPQKEQQPVPTAQVPEKHPSPGPIEAEKPPSQPLPEQQPPGSEPQQTATPEVVPEPRPGTPWTLSDVLKATREIRNPRGAFTIDLRPAHGTGTYRIGQRIVFSFRSDRDCYVYLFVIGTEGDVRLILPNRIEPTTLFERGELHVIPEGGSPFVMLAAPPPGENLVKMIATTREIVLLQERFLKPVGALYEVTEPVEAFGSLASKLRELDPKDWAEFSFTLNVISSD